MKAILAIIKISLAEGLHGKIFAGLVIFFSLFLLFSVYISSLSLGIPARVLKNSGMLGICLVCLAVTVLFGLFTMYREMERNEWYVIFNRVPRHFYLLGRFLGTAVIIFIFSLFAGLGVFIITFFFGGKLAPEIFIASYWASLEFTMLLGVGFLFFSLGTNFTLNTFMVFAVYICGHSLNEAIQSFAALGIYGSRFHLFMVKVISYLFPNFDMFDFRLAIVNSDPIPAGVFLLSSGYWLFYLIALLTASSAALNRRDL